MADALKPGGSAASGRLAWGRIEIAGSGSGWMALLLFLGVVWGMQAIPCLAQEKPKNKPLFLVARPIIKDPFFEKSVVLMLPLGEGQVVVGIVVNKPTRLPLSQLFPNNPALKNRTEIAYLGGPVEMSVPALIFHSATPPKEAIPIYDDVYLTLDGKLIMEELEDPKPTGEMRVFLGRAQWDPAQLNGEALEGSWYSLHAEGNVIFDRDTEHLWKRLHDRAQPPKNIDYRLPDRSQRSRRIAETGLRTLPTPLFPALGFGSNWTARGGSSF